VVLSGNTSVSNFSILSQFRIQKSIGPVYSSLSSQALYCLPLHIIPPPPSWSSSRCSITATSSPCSPPPQLAPYCSPFRTRSSVAIQNPSLVTLVLLGFANPALVHPPAASHWLHLHPPFNPAIGHRYVPWNRSSVQVDTLTSLIRLIQVTYQT